MLTDVRTHEFKSWEEFLDVAREAHNPHVDREWCLVRSYKEALKLADRGWPDGMAHVHGIALPQVRALVSRTVDGAGWAWDVTGAGYDVGEYLTGVPECWLTPASEETKPVVTVNVNLAAPGGASTDALTGRGAAVMALVMTLQTAGYVVDLNACYQTEVGNAGQCAIRVPLVSAIGGPLDLDRIAFMLIHPAGYRALAMAVIRRVFDQTEECSLGAWDGALPWPSNLELRRMSPTNEATWESPEAITAWVEREFNRLTKQEG